MICFQQESTLTKNEATVALTRGQRFKVKSSATKTLIFDAQIENYANRTSLLRWFSLIHSFCNIYQLYYYQLSGILKPPQFSLFANLRAYRLQKNNAPFSCKLSLSTGCIYYNTLRRRSFKNESHNTTDVGSQLHLRCYSHANKVAGYLSAIKVLLFTDKWL